MANFTSKYTGEEIDQAVEKAGKTSQNLIFKYKDGSTQSFNGSTELEVNLGDGGTEVVANPQTSEDDAELNSIQINGKNYKVLSGIKVVNSLPAATEAEYKRHLLYLYNGNIEYLTEVVADEPVVTTPATLPLNLYMASACTVGNDCYIFGGYSGGNNQNRIIKFDSVSQTVTMLSATLPMLVQSASACAVGTDCYIFGGYNAGTYYDTIIKFDTITQEVTTLSATLPFGLSETSACAVGTDCYIFGGYDGNRRQNTIIKFDSVSQSVSTLSTTLPLFLSETSACAVGTDCYIFGGHSKSSYRDTIIKFDSVSQTATTLSATLPREVSKASACAVGTDCYIFGGFNSPSIYPVYYSSIMKFDSVSQTATTLSATLPNKIYSSSACAVGTNCYVFGGYTGGSTLNSIIQVAFGATYTYNSLQKEGEITYEEI